MKVIFSGSVVSNGGDAAIMYAGLEALRQVLPNFKAIILDSVPAMSRRIFPEYEAGSPLVPFRLRGRGRLSTAIRSLQRRRLLALAKKVRLSEPTGFLLRYERKALETFSTADLVAYTGGTSLLERYGVEPKLLELEFAAALGKPTVLLPQSLGPFTSPEVQSAIREAVAYADAVLLRDNRSFTHLEEIGADMSRVRITPDIVFALMDDLAPTRIRNFSVSNERLRVVISARDVAAFSSDGSDGQIRFDRSLAALVTHLVEDRGADVVFASTCQGVARYHHDDSAVAVNIVAGLESEVADRVVVDRSFRTPNELHDYYRTFDVAVVTRLHAAITALNVGLPVLAIAYEFKTREVLGDLGMSRYVVDIEDLGDGILVSQFNTLLAELPTLRGTIADSLEATKSRALRIGPLTEDLLAK